MAESQPYMVSARKYRPATFDSVVGQQALTRTLKNAIAAHKLAQAYLFTGPRGVGKTSCARIFAKTINCLSPTPDGEACGVCDSCRAINEGNSFNIIELDAASNNSVEDIRSITEQVKIAPQVGSYRVFIIDEVHMLSAAAFNAFLKTLEEPPSYVIFILATTEKHKVIPTILSRCQIYDFKRITINDMVDHLERVARQEGVDATREALGVIAEKADGAMRDALSIFDQVAASSMGRITYESAIENLNVLDYDYYFRLIEAFRGADVASALLIYKEIRDKGFDSLFFINGLAAHIRNLMAAADPRTTVLLETSQEIAARYCEQARTLPLPWYYTAMRLLNECDVQYRGSTGKRLLVELTLIRLCQLLNPPQPPFDRIDDVPELQKPAWRPPTSSSQPQSISQPQGSTIAPQPQSSSQPQPPVSSETPESPVPPVASDPAPATYAAPAHGSPTPAPVGMASGPAAAAAAAERPRPASSPRVASFRLREVSSADAAHSFERKAESYTYEQFMEAWAEFAANNPHLHILVNGMRNLSPEPVGDNTYRVVVGHPALLQSFETSMPQLLSFLRGRLGNDFVTVKVEVTDIPAESKMLPAAEFLKKVVADNPSLGELLRDLDAELC